MKFFATRSQFAAKLLTAAGLDLETLFKSGDENALKVALDAAKVAAKPDTAAIDAAKATAVSELFTAAKLPLTDGQKPVEILASLIAAKDELETAEKSLSAVQAENLTLNDSLAAVGYKPPTVKPDATHADAVATHKAALEYHIKIRAQAILAQSGHQALNDLPEKKDGKKMTRAAFDALRPKERADFCNTGGELTE